MSCSCTYSSFILNNMHVEIIKIWKIWNILSISTLLWNETINLCPQLFINLTKKNWANIFKLFPRTKEKAQQLFLFLFRGLLCKVTTATDLNFDEALAEESFVLMLAFTVPNNFVQKRIYSHPLKNTRKTSKRNKKWKEKKRYKKRENKSKT